MLPSRYRSETLIMVEQQKVPEHYVVSNVASDLQNRLQSMSERAALIGGTLSVESRPGRGTRVEVQVPMTGLGVRLRR